MPIRSAVLALLIALAVAGCGREGQIALIAAGVVAADYEACRQNGGEWAFGECQYPGDKDFSETSVIDQRPNTGEETEGDEGADGGDGGQDDQTP